ncbi:hypothetical protein [Micromonospora coerulea]|uniref:hypothetical protein n=1 Tax=Micromonospora coerulea TaxID=47856 RepID=UPI001905618B|nr:hypothetical protein [Micromonospora veneta]
MIQLEAHICDQRRSYRVTFATEAQAIQFVQARSSTHVVTEIEEDGGFDYDAYPKLCDLLYPTCEHGMTGACYGSQHYYFDEEEQARGMLNGY